MYAVKSGGLLLYMPKYGIRTAVHLLDKAGLPKAVLENAEERPDHPAVSERRSKLKVESGGLSQNSTACEIVLDIMSFEKEDV